MRRLLVEFRFFDYIDFVRKRKPPEGGTPNSELRKPPEGGTPNSELRKPPEGGTPNAELRKPPEGGTPNAELQTLANLAELVHYQR
jgi:hypothetical protein